MMIPWMLNGASYLYIFGLRLLRHSATPYELAISSLETVCPNGDLLAFATFHSNANSSFISTGVPAVSRPHSFEIHILVTPSSEKAAQLVWANRSLESTLRRQPKTSSHGGPKFFIHENTAISRISVFVTRVISKSSSKSTTGLVRQTRKGKTPAPSPVVRIKTAVFQGRGPFPLSHILLVQCEGGRGTPS